MKKVLVWTGVLSIIAVGVFFSAKAMQQISLLKKFCIKFRSAKINTFGWNNASINLTVGFKNKSDIFITLKELNLSILVNNSEVAKVNQSVEQLVGPNSWNDVSFDVIFAPSNILSNLFNSNILNAALFDFSKLIINAKGSVGISTQYFGISSLPIDISKPLNEILNKKTTQDDNDCT